MQSLRHEFVADARQVAVVRHLVRAWADLSGLGPLQVERLLLAVGEAVTNAVEHAYRGGAPGLVVVEVLLEGRQVVARICDRGSWRPPGEALLPEGADGSPTASFRGRGLDLMRKLVGRVEVDRDGGAGTVVTLVDEIDPAVA